MRLLVALLVCAVPGAAQAQSFDHLTVSTNPSGIHFAAHTNDANSYNRPPGWALQIALFKALTDGSFQYYVRVPDAVLCTGSRSLEIKNARGIVTGLANLVLSDSVIVDVPWSAIGNPMSADYKFRIFSIADRGFCWQGGDLQSQVGVVYVGTRARGKLSN